MRTDARCPRSDTLGPDVVDALLTIAFKVMMWGGDLKFPGNLCRTVVVVILLLCNGQNTALWRAVCHSVSVWCRA